MCFVEGTRYIHVHVHTVHVQYVYNVHVHVHCIYSAHVHVHEQCHVFYMLVHVRVSVFSLQMLWLRRSTAVWSCLKQSTRPFCMPYEITTGIRCTLVSSTDTMYNHVNENVYTCTCIYMYMYMYIHGVH